MSSSFKTYVDITEHGSEDYEWVINDNEQPKLEPRLLPGEVIVASATNVLKFASLSNRKQGISGKLFVTNFKIAFVSPTSSYSGSSKDERNKFLSPNEVCLANVDHVYQVNGEKRKKLLPGSNVVYNIKTLQIVCKDFSVHSYSFKFCPVGCHKTVINSILHHSFPKRIELLFTYDCTLPATNSVTGMQFFSNPIDWENEVDRCNCTVGWRVCISNDRYQLSPSLPQGFVVPRSLSDNQILKASKHFMINRPPVWCWGHSNNCVIVRMAALQTSITDTKQESIMLEHVRKSHPNLREPRILELDKSMPALQEIQTSWCKFRDTCCSPTDNIPKFWEQDTKFLSLLNNSRWPHHVMFCLRIANRVVEAICYHQVSVVLQENESRDLSAVISSLAQLMMDPYFRTINGFQSLIQKEWVTLGHPFTKRFGRISEYEDKQAPLFQLFLDCVWQMQHQFPASFEFSETYLSSLWDSLHNTVFDTFTFDSQCIRQASAGNVDKHPDHPALMSRSVWDWQTQFHDIDVGLFLNPLFSITCRVGAYRQRRGINPSTPLLHAHHPASPSVPPISPQLNDRPRRNSVSISTLRNTAEYGAVDNGTDTLGRTWGSRFGLAALTEMSSRAEGNGRWKRFRGALFHSNSRSFSPRTKIASIEEGLEIRPYSEEPGVVTYRASRGIVETGQQQRWTVYGDSRTSSFSPLPSCPVKLSPNPNPPCLNLTWENEDIPYHDLDWPVYSILPVADSVVDYQLWDQCYLRWIPAMNIRGGGQPPIYFNQCSIVNDILSLECQLDQLQNQETTFSPTQRFVTMSDHQSTVHAHQTTLSSFHPFVQQQNDSALSFGEWEIIPSLYAGKADTEFDSESIVTTMD